MPRRSFETVEEFESHLGEADELLFDGTEMGCERPKGYDSQKVKFSGQTKGTYRYCDGPLRQKHMDSLCEQTL